MSQESKDKDKEQQHQSSNSNITGLLRTASLSTLFTRKRPYDSDADDTSAVNIDSSDEQDTNDEATHEHEHEHEHHLHDHHQAKRSKTAKDAARLKFMEQEQKYDEELPEEYRKFRPTGHRLNMPPTDRPVRVYADGVFDLFHLGHMRQLEQAKKALPNVVLICGIPSDFETHKRKGLTVLSDYQRCETLKHCKWVDEVIPDAPWCVTTQFLEKHKIDYVAHDDLPYASADSDDIYLPIKLKGMFLTTQRTDGVSTSDIITKIIRDYDKYLMRNFARGATRQELNVSWFKKNELEFKKHINDFRSYWKKTNQNFNNASKDLYFEVREYLLNKSAQKGKKHKGMSSPAADFAADYTGDRSENHDKRSRRRSRHSPSPSFIDNFKDWMNRADSEIADSPAEVSSKHKLKNSRSARARGKVQGDENENDNEEDEDDDDEDTKTLIPDSTK